MDSNTKNYHFLGEMQLPRTEEYFKKSSDELKAWAEQHSSTEVFYRGLSLVNQACSSAKNSTTSLGRHFAVIALVAIALQSLRALEHLAAKEERTAVTAIEWRIRVISEAVRSLNKQAINDPRNYRPFAEYIPTWPMMYSPNKSLKTDYKELQRELKIGEQFWHNLKGRKRSLDFSNGEKELAKNLLEVIRSNQLRVPEQNDPEWVKKCRTVPVFSSLSFDDWWNLAWNVVLDAYPEPEIALAPLAGFGPSPDRSPKVVRSAIKARIKQALKKLAPNQSNHSQF